MITSRVRLPIRGPLLELSVSEEGDAVFIQVVVEPHLSASGGTMFCQCDRRATMSLDSALEVMAFCTYAGRHFFRPK